MFRYAYVNGRYVRHGDAAIHVDDRGYQFSDGAYEVMAVWNGLPVDFDLHMARLSRSLGALSISQPMAPAALKVVLRTLLAKNRVRRGMLYLQVSRGVAPRNHLFPKPSVRPSMVATARAYAGPSASAVENGVSVVALPDIRWSRRDIKSISLLPNVMAKQKASEVGAFEAWLTEEDDTVTEASSSNAWIIDRDGRLITRPTGPDILAGITRHIILELARGQGMEVVERPFTLDEARNAREAFISSSTSFVLPVVEIDGAIIGNGRPGSLAQGLRRLYIARLDALTPESAWS